MIEQIEFPSIAQDVIDTAAAYVRRETTLMSRDLRAHAKHQSRLLDELAAREGIDPLVLRIIAVSALTNY